MRGVEGRDARREEAGEWWTSGRPGGGGGSDRWMWRVGRGSGGSGRWMVVVVVRGEFRRNVSACLWEGMLLEGRAWDDGRCRCR